LGLKSDGGIVAWGLNDLGQCNVSAPNANFVAVAGGAYHSLGLKSDGSVVAWGSNDYGEGDVPAPNTDFVAIAAGDSHSLGLTSNGAVVAWGNNEYGQCDVPAPNADFVAVAGGRWHSLGLKSDGTIVAWGANHSGQCSVPAPNLGFVAIDAGRQFSLGLKTDGSIVAWGYNRYGQCNVPAPNEDFVAVAGGGDQSLGVKSDGTVVAWGNNDSGQCNVPAPNAGFVLVAGGGDHSLGLKCDGAIVAWGSNSYGQCNAPAPNTGFVAVAGWSQCLGLRFDGTIAAWGDNSNGQCNVPAPNTDFVAIAAGGYHSLGLKSDGSVVAWGRNNSGQCTVPTPNSGFVMVEAGRDHSLGLKSDGTIVAWGSNLGLGGNYTGQCDVPAPNEGFVAIEGGGFHSFGLKSDGSIVAWGDNSHGQCDVPVPNTDFVQVSGGTFFSHGLKIDGSVEVWGDNAYGRYNVPEPNSGFTAVTGGNAHSLAVRGGPPLVSTLVPWPVGGISISCGQSAVLAFHFTPSFDAPAVRGYSIRVQATSALSFTPGDITVNVLPPGEQVFHQIIENGPNDYTIDYTILSTTTLGITDEADLFTVLFRGGVDGTGTVSIPSAQLRDLQNQPIALDYSATATVVVDCSPPGPVTGIMAAPGHEKVTVSWEDPGDPDLTAVEVWRALWHAPAGGSVYPEYDDVANVIPTRPASREEAETSAEWTLAGTVDPGVDTFIDLIAARGVYYYEVFARDDVSSYGLPAATNARATNYWLGDFNSYDGYVDVPDLTVLGAAYGTTPGQSGYNAEVDVGPTSDASAHGIPLTDSVIGFEDMMIVGLNFGAVQPKVPAVASGPVHLTWARLDEQTWSLSLVEPNAGLMGLHLRGRLPEGAAAQLREGALLARQMAPVFLRDIRGEGMDISLGVMGAAVSGIGELFRVELNSAAEIGELQIEARSTTNEALEVLLDEVTAPNVPLALRLYPNAPNPFNPMTTLRFDIPVGGRVHLAVYDVAGRLVRVLVEEELPAGTHQAVWDGRDSAGRAVASGSYFARLEAGGKVETVRMGLVR
jgi:alpha-tubulin suppressor-like RCC1 family protein